MAKAIPSAANWMPLRGGDLPYYVFALSICVVLLIRMQLVMTPLSNPHTHHPVAI